MNDFLASGSYLLCIPAFAGMTGERLLFSSNKNDKLDNEEFLVGATSIPNRPQPALDPAPVFYYDTGIA